MVWADCKFVISCGWWFIQHTNHSFHYVIDVGEVSAVFAVIENRNGFVCKNRLPALPVQNALARYSTTVACVNCQSNVFLKRSDSSCHGAIPAWPPNRSSMNLGPTPLVPPTGTRLLCKFSFPTEREQRTNSRLESHRRFPGYSRFS